MKYQLVIQWPASSLTDYDAMVKIEDSLIEQLSEEHDVDGHDFGSGEMNIFVHTDDPESAFEEVRSILGSDPSWSSVRVAYRELLGSGYTPLWPEGLREFRVV